MHIYIYTIIIKYACAHILTPMHTPVHAYPTDLHILRYTQSHTCTCACKHRIYCPNTLGSVSHSLKPYDLVTFMAHLFVY